MLDGIRDFPGAFDIRVRILRGECWVAPDPACLQISCYPWFIRRWRLFNAFPTGFISREDNLGAYRLWRGARFSSCEPQLMCVSRFNGELGDPSRSVGWSRTAGGFTFTAPLEINSILE